MRIGRASLRTKLLILILLVVAGVSLLELNSRVQQAQAERDALAQQVLEQTQTNAELEEAIENSDDPEWIAAVARDKLGLVSPGEIIFYGVNSGS